MTESRDLAYNVLKIPTPDPNQYFLVENAVALAEREANQVPTCLLIVVEHLVRHGHRNITEIIGTLAV